jgi:DNA-binding MarR family transcriptional regulator
MEAGTVADRLEPEQLGTYFAFVEASSLLAHRVELQLRADGDLSTVQFQILGRLTDAAGHRLTMTDLADGLVYSRSGLTYQAGLLEKAGLVTRGPSPDDDRATLVTVTPEGMALFRRVLPGHIEVVRHQLLDTLTAEDVGRLGEIMFRVRDHMRSQPPRSAAPRRRRAAG